ncbi:glycosyltransferase family 17 protein [Dothistroma septosporum NZE10]|uniref:Glycosyltransferase family 17 protein n=1 Tax=Dothistroma septosporum (strain NZE10 / CBS 128990) TaxID=675120 RepID=N1PHL9_DOTSN|nr:glycosyltransferase family 17 protein [Dothistroma septosporum NZE10]
MYPSPSFGKRNGLIALAVIASLLLVIVSSRHANQATIKKKAFGYAGPRTEAKESGVSPGSRAFSTPGQIDYYCKAHKLKAYKSKDVGQSHRKIYDAFLFSNELDWLEIRLATLAPYVDYFVIVEAPTTFTGREKPLYLEENWDRFNRFHKKIIRKTVLDPGQSLGLSTWAHEGYFRNSVFDATFPSLVYTSKEAHEGDVVILSDVDEIPKPETMKILRHCDVPDRLTLRSQFYYYSFQWLHVGEQWPHPQATVFHGLQNTLSPNDLRHGYGGPVSWIPFWGMINRWYQKAELLDAAWHCSSCFATLDEMRKKMSSFSHTPLDTEENRNEAVMLRRVRTGQDLFGRPGELYDRVDNNTDVPPFILKHEERFHYLLNRDGENAGFSDYGAWEPPPT